MPSDQSFWYRLGYALERARGPLKPPGERSTKRPRRLASLEERAPGRSDPPARPLTDDLVVAGTAALAAKLLDAWRPRGHAGPLRLLRAGLAGAGASLLVDFVGPLFRGSDRTARLDASTADRLLVGAAQGLLYAGVVEPRVPGPTMLKGTLYGSTEYMAAAAGGLSRLLGTRGPLRRIPLLADLLEDLDPHDRAYLEHVTFGIVLALLYGSNPRSNGIAPPDDDVE